ncbi:MAG TPA: M20/M25/M40 family metallo-hydrolase [bacterium]|nr:M20/M25/M40 family metallo-hydrolase [bacterium]
MRRIVSEVVTEHAPRYVRALKDLVALGREGETAIQAHVRDRLCALGAQVDLIAYDPRQLSIPYEFVAPDLVAPGPRASVVGIFRGAGAGRSLLLFAHPDLEPTDGPGGGQPPPFRAVPDGGRIFGRGVADDLAGLSAMCCALETVRAAAADLPGTVVLASAPSKGHARGIVPVLDRLPPLDGGLYLHPAESGEGLAQLKTATPGTLRFLVHISGRPPDTLEPDHTPFAAESVNPIDLATTIASAVRRLADQTGLAGVSAALTYLAAGSRERLHRVPVVAEVGMTVAFPPAVRLAAVRAAVEGAIRDQRLTHPWLAHHPPTLRWLSGTAGAAVDEADDIVHLTVTETAGVTGRAPTRYARHASSDIRHPILHRGIPTVGLGPRAGSLGQAGGIGEWVDLGEYLQTITITAAVILRWCGTSAVAAR